MPSTAVIICDGCLLLEVDGVTHAIPIGTAGWFAWLCDAQSFTFRSTICTFTARREHAQRGTWYWRAYHKRGGVLHRAYLGKSGALTLRKLEAVAATLAERGEGARDPTPTPPRRGEGLSAPPSEQGSMSNLLPSPRRGGAGGGVLFLPDMTLQTKVMVPRLGSGLLERAELRGRLTAHMHRTLTLVSAPVGFGKTTLLSLWCQSATEHGRAVAWLSLDQADNDPQCFWAYVVRAFQPMFGNVAQHDEQLALLHLQPLETAVSRLLNALIGLPHPVTLVLDDYDVIVEQAIHTSLAHFIANVPSTVRVMLASRTDPPLQLARLRIRGELMELRAPDLCLTADEIGAFVMSTLHVDLPGEVITALATATEGWIGAVQIAALGLREQSDPAAIVSALRGSHHHLVEYFAEEVLQHIPSHVQDFLLHTSILDRLHPALCDAVTKRRDGAEMLDQLYHANLFLIPLDADHAWYRYHPLFADFLRDRLAYTAPERTATLQCAASRWYEANGLWNDAVQYALAGRAYDVAARLLADHAHFWFRRGEANTLLAWISVLPDATIMAHPRLCLVHMSALLLKQRWQCVEERLRAMAASGVLKATYAASHHEHAVVDAIPGQGELLVVRAFAVLVQGDVASAAALLEQATSIAEHHDAFLQGCLRVGAAAIAWLQGDATRAQHMLANLQPRELGGSARDIALLAMAHQAHFYGVQGELYAACLGYEEVRAVAAPQERGQGPSWAMATVGLGMLLYERNDLEGANRCVREAVNFGEQWDDANLMVSGYAMLAQIAQARHDEQLSDAMLHRAEQIALPQNVSELARLNLLLGRVAIALARDDVPRAAALMVGYEQRRPYQLRGVEERMQTVMVRVLLAQGRAEEALSLLTPLRRAAEQAGRWGSVVPMLIFEARAKDLIGRRREACGVLEAALVQAAPRGFRRSFVDEGTTIVPLLSHALRQTAEPQYVRALLEACAAHIPHETHVLVGVLQPLSQREREVLRLAAAGASNTEIARVLVVTMGTVKKHMSNILQKLEVRSRTQAIAQARRHNLL